MILQTNKTNEVGDENTFWSWFKGLINPLQNLPIISGIYSSLNSDNQNQIEILFKIA